MSNQNIEINQDDGDVKKEITILNRSDNIASNLKTLKPNKQEVSCIGYYSIDQSEYKNDISSLKYVKIPEEINFNLKSSSVQKIANDQSFLNRLNQLIRFINNNYDIVKGDAKPIAADFVCTRGVLKKIMEFKNFPDKFKIYSSKLKNTIYLALEYDDAEFINFGHEFEKLLLSSEFDAEPGETHGLEFCLVVERIIGDFRILFNVECDGIESDAPVKDLEDLKKATIVELKTRINKQKFRHNKYFTWLIQSHIAGIIDKIYEGKRDENGIVKEIIIHELKQLEDDGKEQYGYDLNQCYAYLGNFLRRVKDDMSNVENHKEVFVYSFIKRGFYEKLSDMSFEYNQSHPLQVKTTEWMPSPIMENRKILPNKFVKFLKKIDQSKLFYC